MYMFPRLRESCAIIFYLVEKYDTERKISVEEFNDKMIEQQWLFFQSSGQGLVNLTLSAFFGRANMLVDLTMAK